MPSQRAVMYLLVLVGGAATMGVEMCASRLLAPYFGNSLPVWGVIIGLLLSYLAIGYALGGRAADKYPEARVLYKTAAWAAAAIGCVPYLAGPILRWSVVGLAGYQAGPVLGSLLGVMGLFTVPVILLGSLSPFAIRLSVEAAAGSGRVAGRIYAMSTAGSLLGTFLSVFVLIPNIGTRRTIFAISLSLLVVSLAGLYHTARRHLLRYLFLLVALLALQFWSLGSIKPTKGLIYETDTAYNYLQVIRQGEEIVLKLNEGEGIQSVYQPGRTLTGYFYDYFLLAPFFRSVSTHTPVDSVCVLGLAAGTAARQYSTVFGPASIDGIEIDPAIVEVGTRFFDLVLPNLDIIIEDGRYFLKHTDSRYDVVLVDAYVPPYIPFQLTTVEFFREVRDHLDPDGVVAINVARTETDYALVDAIASTLKSVYPSVFVVETLGNLNSIVIASLQHVQLTDVEATLARLSDPNLSNVAARASGRIWEFARSNREPLTDDLAPVEQIVHAILAGFLAS